MATVEDGLAMGGARLETSGSGRLDPGCGTQARIERDEPTSRRCISVIGGEAECAGRPARSRWCKSITMKE
jgi:hypothetical protein